MQIGHCWPAAAIGNELYLLTGRFLKQDAGELSRGILIDEGDLVGIGFHPGDKVFQVVRRQRFLADHQLRIERYQADRIEILHEIVVQRIDDARDMRVPLADVDRVTVRLRAREPADRDTAASATDILDDDGLAERLFHPL